MLLISPYTLCLWCHFLKVVNRIGKRESQQVGDVSAVIGVVLTLNLCVHEWVSKKKQKPMLLLETVRFSSLESIVFFLLLHCRVDKATKL